MGDALYIASTRQMGALIRASNFTPPYTLFELDGGGAETHLLVGLDSIDGRTIVC
jgi:hypothetical protein